MKKKTLASLLCGVLLVSVIITGCGNKASNNETQKPTDTTAPVVTVNQNYVITNDVSKIDTSLLATYTDETSRVCTVAVTNFTKVDDLKVLDDTTITTYTNALATPESVTVDTTIPTEEGIYNAILSVTDEAGNITNNAILIVVDKTAPVAEFVDVTVKVEDLSTEPTITVPNVDIVDNVDGVISKDKAEVTATKVEGEEHKYIAVVKVSDRAGNVLEGSFYVTVEQGAPDDKDNQDNDDKPGTPDKPDTPDEPNKPDEPDAPDEPGDDDDDDYPDYPVEDEFETINGFTINLAECYGRENDARALCRAGLNTLVDYTDIRGCGMIVKDGDLAWAEQQLEDHVTALGYDGKNSGISVGPFFDNDCYWVSCLRYAEWPEIPEPDPGDVDWN